MKEKRKKFNRHVLANVMKRSKRKILSCLSIVSIFSLIFAQTAFAAEPDPTVNTGIFDTIVTGAEKGAKLFTIYPVNIFLGASILMMAVGILFAFKKRAKS